MAPKQTPQTPTKSVEGKKEVQASQVIPSQSQVPPINPKEVEALKTNINDMKTTIVTQTWKDANKLQIDVTQALKAGVAGTAMLTVAGSVSPVRAQPAVQPPLPIVEIRNTPELKQEIFGLFIKYKADKYGPMYDHLDPAGQRKVLAYFSQGKSEKADEKGLTRGVINLIKIQSQLAESRACVDYYQIYGKLPDTLPSTISPNVEFVLKGFAWAEAYLDVETYKKIDDLIHSLAQAEIAQSDAKIAQNRKELAQWKAELAQWKAELAQWKAELAQWKAELVVTKTRIAQTDVRIAQNKTEIAKLDKQIAALKLLLGKR